MKQLYWSLLFGVLSLAFNLRRLEDVSQSAQSLSAVDRLKDQEWTFEKEPFWADEFDYIGLPDATKWSYDLGGNGWGNRELQYYTRDYKNAHVEEGMLKITAIKEDRGGMAYTSARLVSKNKGDFLYGRFEVKIRLPKGRGTWSAAWMLPTDEIYGHWPRSGEIDMMEHVGFNQNSIHMSVHTQAYNHILKTEKTKFRIVPGVSEDFHLYRIDWTPDAIQGFVDDVPLFNFLNKGQGIDEWPFDKQFHLLLNLAVGGDWGGVKGVDPEIFPASMDVDYVRVYKMKKKT